MRVGGPRLRFAPPRGRCEAVMHRAVHLHLLLALSCPRADGRSKWALLGHHGRPLRGRLVLWWLPVRRHRLVPGHPVRERVEVAVDPTETPGKYTDFTDGVHQLIVGRPSGLPNVVLEGHELWHQWWSEGVEHLRWYVWAHWLRRPRRSEEPIFEVPRQGKWRMGGWDRWSGPPQHHDETIGCAGDDSLKLDRRQWLTMVRSPPLSSPWPLTLDCVAHWRSLATRGSVRVARSHRVHGFIFFLLFYASADSGIILVQGHATVQLSTTAFGVTGAAVPVLISHWMIFSVNSIVVVVVVKIACFSGVTGPETQVGDGVVGLCSFKALHCIRQAPLLDASVEALVLDLIWGQPEDRGYGIGGEHD
ncbi:hypothetical protein FJTKL_07127 [Diaporthe vaccinii]|uniref:Uncharacterized protein n=1 Tax=Diaporthe vaccinii TaxID=105482 RepID=A0ABR4EV85_9PEZI